VRWKGYGPEYDEWYGINLLEDAAEMVARYDNDHPVDSLKE
jgi:hypothetical protein